MEMNDLRQIAYTTPRPDVFAMVPPTAMSVLDVGCSNGALGASLRSILPERKITGIEYDPVFVAQAATQLDRVVRADLNDFDWTKAFPNELFDCIVFADVLEHLLDPQRLLIEAQNCLRPGGSIVVSLPNIRHLSSLYSIFIKGTFPQRDRGIFDKTHLRWFTLRDAERLVAGAGMKIEAIDYSLRIGDQGGGILNKISDRLLNPVRRFAPIREFVTYQFCLRAVRTA